jgi:hypothetical protein
VKCDACLFADGMIAGGAVSDAVSSLPEHERFAFTFANGIGRVLSGMPICLCPEHYKDAQAMAQGMPSFNDLVKEVPN